MKEKHVGMEKLRLERLKQGLSQRELAEKSGLHINTIFRVEAGDSKPNLRSLQKISSVLGCDISALIGNVELPEACAKCPFYETLTKITKGR